MARGSRSHATPLGVYSALILLASGAAGAQQLIVYPARGQTLEQSERDKSECMTWARQQSGFDPAASPAPAYTPPPPSPQGGVLRGGARGAAVGAVGGAIAGDAGKGAAIGAASGALIGGFRQRDRRLEQEDAYRQSTNQQAQQYNQARATFDRAYAACLEGRGYTVK